MVTNKLINIFCEKHENICKCNKIGIHSMGKVILFIMKEIIVQQYTFFRIGSTYITSYCNSATKNVHIFIIYV